MVTTSTFHFLCWKSIVAIKSDVFFKKIAKTSMPNVCSRQIRRLRRLRPKKSRPRCLCARSLSSTLTEPSNIHVVLCKHGCKRASYYFHDQCATLYCNILRHCGYCKNKLVAKKIVNTNLLKTIQNTRSLAVRGA